MQRDEAIRRIRETLPRLQHEYRVVAVSLIGSTARNEARDDSDVDVLADWDTAPSLDEFMGLKFALEELLGTSVDLLDRAGLAPRWKEIIEKDALLVA